MRTLHGIWLATIVFLFGAIGALMAPTPKAAHALAAEDSVAREKQFISGGYFCWNTLCSDPSGTSILCCFVYYPPDP